MVTVGLLPEDSLMARSLDIDVIGERHFQERNGSILNREIV